MAMDRFVYDVRLTGDGPFPGIASRRGQRRLLCLQSPLRMSRN